MGVLAVAMAVVVPPAGFGELRKSREEDGEDQQQRRQASSSPHFSSSLGFWSSLAKNWCYCILPPAVVALQSQSVRG
jgi:hypothetical protein